MLNLTDLLPWKIFTGIAAAASLVLAFFLLLAHAETRSLTKTVANRDATIKTLNADVAREQQNAATLTSTLKQVRADLEAKAAADAAKLAETTAALKTAQANTVAARASAARLAAPAKGDTLDARVRDVDARLLETLK